MYAQLVEQGYISRDQDLLPPQVDDQRSLFHIDPSAPKLATPIMRVTWQGAEVLRQARKRVPRLSAWVARRLAVRARKRDIGLERLELTVL